MAIACLKSLLACLSAQCMHCAALASDLYNVPVPILCHTVVRQPHLHLRQHAFPQFVHYGATAVHIYVSKPTSMHVRLLCSCAIERVPVLSTGATAGPKHGFI
jgi:hypothetical protein